MIQGWSTKMIEDLEIYLVNLKFRPALRKHTSDHRQSTFSLEHWRVLFDTRKQLNSHGNLYDHTNISVGNSFVQVVLNMDESVHFSSATISMNELKQLFRALADEGEWPLCVGFAIAEPLLKWWGKQ